MSTLCKRASPFGSVVLILFSVVPLSVAQTEGPSVIGLGSGPYQLVPKLVTGSCADVTSVSKANGALMQLWACGGPQATNEYWSLAPINNSHGGGYQVVSLNSGLCLDVDGVSTANGALLQQWQCGGAQQLNQVWQIVSLNGLYELVSENSGKCLDLSGGKTSNGVLLQQWDCGQGNNPNQLWGIVPLNALPPVIPLPLSTGAVPANYFGLSTLNFQYAQPSFAYGTARSWDEYPYLDWAEVNPAPGIYNFTFVDNFINLNQGLGRDMIYTLGRTPLWASSSPLAVTPYGPGECAAPWSLASWDTYVQAIVAHSSGRIHYWELWNEPNDSQFYCGDIRTMVNMARDAYRIIKSIDPTAQVLSPAVTSLTGPAWLTSYLQAGGGQYADIIAFHGYWDTSAESIHSVVQNYRSILSTNGQGTKPLWDTEASFGSDPAHIVQGEAARAAFLAKYYLLQGSDGVSRFIWYAYDSGLNGGLWDSSSGLHAAGRAYVNVQQWMVGSQVTQPCTSDTSGTWTCVFSRNGDQAEVIWNSMASIYSQVNAAYTQETDLSGATQSLINSSVLVGNSPLLLRTGGSY